MQRRVKQIAAIVLLLSLANIFLAIFVGVVLGGSAEHGKIESGRYYIGDRGNYREVPHWVWVYSKIHMTSMFICVALWFLAYGTLAYLEKRRSAS
jgi:hypothetical protein